MVGFQFGDFSETISKGSYSQFEIILYVFTISVHYTLYDAFF